MRRKYTIVTSLDIHHDFYEGNRSRDLEWIPAPSTLERFQSMGLVYKRYGSQLFILANIDDQHKPLSPWDLRDPWVFFFRIRNGRFGHVTNLPGLDDQLKYYFSSLRGVK